MSFEFVEPRTSKQACKTQIRFHVTEARPIDPENNLHMDPGGLRWPGCKRRE